MTGRVTNEAATNYILRRSGGLDLDAQSGAAYWTHYGPSGWYLDAVAQATRYQGSASTQFAGLATTGFGFVSSLETGHPSSRRRRSSGNVCRSTTPILS